MHRFESGKGISTRCKHVELRGNIARGLLDRVSAGPFVLIHVFLAGAISQNQLIHVVQAHPHDMTIYKDFGSPFVRGEST